MKSLLKENVNINFNTQFPEEDNAEKIANDIHFDFYQSKLIKDIEYYNKIPKKHRNAEIQQLASLLFEAHLKMDSRDITIPSEFRTKENLFLEIKRVNEQNIEQQEKINKINNIFSTYPEDAKTKENTELYIKSGGSLKYLNRKNLSAEMWKAAIKQNNSNFLFFPEKTLSAEIIRFIKMSFCHYRIKTVCFILLFLLLLTLLISFFIGGLSLLLFILVHMVKILAYIIMGTILLMAAFLMLIFMTS